MNCFSQNAQIQNIANQLLISNDYEVKIKVIHPEIDGIIVVQLSTPYREFPSIILLKRENDNFTLIFECLGPGIQDKQSKLLDWHTKKLGVDFIIGDGVTKTNLFNDKHVKSIIESSSKQKGTTIIAYEQFFHMSLQDPHKTFDLSPYTIDKTQYQQLANKLLDNRFDTYPIDQCLMYDTPEIIKTSFSKTNDGYEITAETSNAQIWTYTFNGIDEQNQYLINKIISVHNSIN
ncbi:MAG: hypothetical protein P8H25_06815 [Flavobacteriaceae bacterium]|nr:hypothetical protein [Flavobacteriaceae bacterium]